MSLPITIVLGGEGGWSIPGSVLDALSALPGATVVSAHPREVAAPGVVTLATDPLRSPLVAAAEVVLTEDLPAPAGARGMVLRLRPASQHGHVLCVDHGLPLDEAGRAEAAALALTSVIWEETDEMPVTWRIELASPVSGTHVAALRSHAGRNALIALPTHLTVAQAESALAPVRTSHQGWALHAHAGMGAVQVEDGIFVWPAVGAGLWPLLGKMDAVIADPGPLAWDAARLGIPVRGLGLGDRSAERLLADVVPAGLATETSFWSGTLALLARCRAEGRAVPPLLQAAEVRRWREQRFRPPPPAKPILWRRLSKLVRHPRLYCRDSSFALLRWLGR